MSRTEASEDIASSPAPQGRTASLARFVLAHRRIVMVGWLIVFLAGAVGASHVSKRLSLDFSLPGQPGYETARKIMHTYGNGGDQPPAIMVVSAPAGQTIRGDQAQLSRAFARVRGSVHGVRVLDYSSTGDPRMISADGRSTYAFLYTPQEHSFGAPKAAQHATQVLAASLPHGTQIGLTGIQQLAENKSGSGPGVFLETLVGGLGALAVLAFVFASMLAFIPLVIAAVSILSTLLVILALTYVANVSFIVQFLVSLVGLGVAIDYSLLIVTRWREERAHGRDNHDAVVVAMATAGRAVVLSGLTVAIGLVALVVLPVPGLRFGRLWRHADPAGLHLRVADAVAGAAGRHRPAHRLAAHPPRGPRQPPVDDVVERDGAPPRTDRGASRS